MGWSRVGWGRVGWGVSPNTFLLVLIFSLSFKRIRKAESYESSIWEKDAGVRRGRADGGKSEHPPVDPPPTCSDKCLLPTLF